ncbi:unnamed protein product [Effrenium voratum]|nr:unnamed protein product [Effrenium voratum]
MSAESQIQHAQAATYALLDGQANLRSQRQQLADYCAVFQQQVRFGAGVMDVCKWKVDFQQRRLSSAEQMLAQRRGEFARMEAEREEVRRQLRDTQQEAQQVERSRHDCAAETALLAQKGQGVSGECAKQLADIEAKVRELRMKNALARSAVENAQVECQKMRAQAHDMAHRQAVAEDQMLHAAEERRLRDRVLTAKVHEIVMKLERSKALRQVQERCRRERIQTLLDQFYQMAAAPKLEDLPNPFE